MTTAVHDALEALLQLRAENGAITPADLADAVLTHDLDEVEAETLAQELENHGAAQRVTDEHDGFFAERPREAEQCPSIGREVCGRPSAQRT